MSNDAPRSDGSERQGLPALESAVSRTVGELRELRRRVAEGARRSADLEALLAGFQSGAETPDRMRLRLERLEEENRDLRARIAQGRESVERLLARIRFLENQK